MKDLDGLLVVAVEQAVAAPYASGRLADAGARVIKVERKEGDFARRYDAHACGESAYFVWLNRGKQSICLDLKTQIDLDLLRSMIARADILIQNLAPGALARMGLDPIELQRTQPALIICNISGYGEDGPLRDLKAYDLLVQAESGLVGINGGPNEPARVGVSVCDIAAGMTAFQAILQALIGRSHTGQGRIIDVSLFHAMADWMNVPYLQRRYGGHAPKRMGLHHPTIAPYGAYPCKGGAHILISIQNEREWQHLCSHVLGDPAMAADPQFDSNPKRVANRQALDAIITDVFGRSNRDRLVERLQSAGIAFGKLSSLDDLISHPQSRFIQVQTDHGEIELLSPGAVVRGSQNSYGKVPTLDADGQTIRTEFASPSTR